jgi:hypothetical protein
MGEAPTEDFFARSDCRKQPKVSYYRFGNRTSFGGD